VIRGVLFAALFSLGATTAAHEEDFPLLAGGGGTNAASDTTRPSQPAGQTLPLRPTRTIDFTTDEGTWMSVDLAPNGQRIVFDLLGDLYEIDSSGGEAKALTRGMGFDVQPTYSPDGQWIAFISDRSGADNVWVMRNDGSNLRQISLGGDDTVLASPAWAPDGRSIYVSRFRWSLHNYELWRYELDGTEQLLIPIQDEGGTRKSSLGAAVSPDGRYVYFARRVGNRATGGGDRRRRNIGDGAECTGASKIFRRLLSSRAFARRPLAGLCDSLRGADGFASARFAYRRRSLARFSRRA
jgi:hypothetical protein